MNALLGIFSFKAVRKDQHIYVCVCPDGGRIFATLLLRCFPKVASSFYGSLIYECVFHVLNILYIYIVQLAVCLEGV